MYVQSRLLTAAGVVRHCFCTRVGGVSEGLFATLNCGLGTSDGSDNVRLNQRNALSILELPNPKLVICNQKHTAKAIFVREPWDEYRRPDADGMVTNCPGIALGVLTADCAPVLMLDPIKKIIGAAHVGWRGAINGILDSTLALMQENGSKTSEIIAAIGPCIAQKSYEVGKEFRDHFVYADTKNKVFFVEGNLPGKFQFDISGYASMRLTQLGITEISKSNHDTCSEEDMFFSYRRAIIRGESEYGRGLSLIALPK